jgi:hypothetical protein
MKMLPVLFVGFLWICAGLLLFFLIQIPIFFIVKGLMVTLLQILAVVTAFMVAYLGIAKPVMKQQELKPAVIGVVLGVMLLFLLLGAKISVFLGSVMPGAVALPAAVQTNIDQGSVVSQVGNIVGLAWNQAWFVAVILAVGSIVFAILSPKSLNELARWLEI